MLLNCKFNTGPHGDRVRYGCTPLELKNLTEDFGPVEWLRHTYQTTIERFNISGIQFARFCDEPLCNLPQNGSSINTEQPSVTLVTVKSVITINTTTEVEWNGYTWPEKKEKADWKFAPLIKDESDQQPDEKVKNKSRQIAPFMTLYLSLSFYILILLNKISQT